MYYTCTYHMHVMAWRYIQCIHVLATQALNIHICTNNGHMHIHNNYPFGM